MASLLPPLVQTLRGDASQLTATYKEVSSEADAMAASTDAAGNKISATHAKVSASAAKMGTGVLLGTAAVLGLSTAAAVAAQTVDSKLNVSIKNAGGSMAALTPKIQAADAAGNKLGFTNDQVNSSLATLTTALGSPKKALADLAVAQDVARAKGVDLSTASLAVAKAAGGQATALQRLGIVIPTQQLAGLTTASQKGAAILDVLKSKVGGTADAYGKTLKGQVQATGAQFDALGITIGNKLIPILTKALTVITGFINFLKDNKGVATALGIAIGVIATALAAYSIATKIAAAAQLLFNVALDANPIGIIILAIVALVAAIVLISTHWKQVSAFLMDTWKNVSSFFITIGKDISNWWNGFWKGIGDFASSVFKAYIDVYVGIFKFLYNTIVSIGTDISNWWNGFWDGLFNYVTNQWNQGVKEWTALFQLVYTGLVSIGKDVSTWWNGLWNGVVSFVQGVWKDAGNGIIGFINNVIDAINGLLGGINTVLAGVKTASGGAINLHIGNIPHIPSFDVGGVVPGPTGSPLLAVVHGGEPILSNSMMAGNTPIPQPVVNAVQAQQGTSSGGNVYATFNTNANPAVIQASLGWLLKRAG